jgi:hypothetical protein
LAAESEICPVCGAERGPSPERRLGISGRVRPAGMLERMGLVLACFGVAATVFFLLVCLRVATINLGENDFGGLFWILLWFTSLTVAGGIDALAVVLSVLAVSSGKCGKVGKRALGVGIACLGVVFAIIIWVVAASILR